MKSFTDGQISRPVPAVASTVETEDYSSRPERSKKELLAEYESAPDDLPCLDERVLAAVYNCSTEKFQRDRWAGIGLPYYKLGRLVRYKKADVRAELEKNRRVAAA